MPGKVVTWLLGVWLIAESIAQALARNGFKNWNVYLLLSFAEIIIVTTFFREMFTNKDARSIIVWIAWAGLGLVCTEYAISKSADNTFTMFFECTFFFGMGLYAFYEMVFDKIPFRYGTVVMSVMIMFLSSAIYFMTWRFLKYDEALFRLFGNVHAYLLIGCYSFFTYSLWRLQS